MKKVLFTHSYFLRLDPKQWKLQQAYPPLATITAAAVLREAGFEISLHDSMFASGAGQLAPVLQREKPEVLVIYDDGFNYLTKMCLTNMRQEAFKMAQMAKQAGCMVVVSSSDATDHCEKYLSQEADIVIIGEAEITLLELLKNPQNKQQIQGLAFLHEGRLVKTAPRPVLTRLDSLPLPAWDLVNMTQYRETWLKKYNYFSLNMVTTRGCPYKCNWCAKPIYGNRYNSRSPQQVVEELALLTGKYGASHIWFCDDIFGLKPGWVEEFGQLVSSRDIRFRFKIQSRADLLAKENTVAALAGAGCESVWIGAESGSQKILDAMDKGISLAQIEQATRLMKKYGIKPAFFLQFGYLGETRQDIEATLAMLLRLMPHDIGISVSYPLPGTGFYEKVKAGLSEKTNWTDSNDLDMMFSNTYSPAFYRVLHRWVHRSFRSRQAQLALGQLWQQPRRLSSQQLKKALSFFVHTPAAMIEKAKLSKLWH